MTDHYLPPSIAPVAGTFHVAPPPPDTDTSNAVTTDEADKVNTRPQSAGFEAPPSPFNAAEESILRAVGPNELQRVPSGPVGRAVEFLNGPIDPRTWAGDPKDLYRRAANHDAQVSLAWQEHQARTQAPDRSAYPPGYRPYTVDWHPASLVPTLGADQVPDINHAAPAREERSRPGVAPREVEARPAPRPSAGGGGGPAQDPYAQRLGADFNERLAAMGDESAARGASAQQIADAYGRAADTSRNNALSSAAQAHDNAEQARARIAEIDQLNHDYAAGHIDQDKWWTDRSVPGKFAAVLGNMLAGWSGGVQGALSYYHALVDGTLSLQKEEIDRKYKAGQMADNLLASFVRTSDNELEATDKARAALYGAAMTEVAQASAAAKGPVEEAQVRQLMADMKATRDAALAKIAGQRAAGIAQSARGLEVNPQSIVGTRQAGSFLIPDKTWADDVKNTFSAYDRLEDGIRTGLQILGSRSTGDYVNPWSANIRQGEGVNATIQESLAKLSSARGVPTNIQQIAREALPDFGSRTGAIDRPKAEQMLRQIDQWRASTLQAANAIPVDVQSGPGVGKKANEWTYYATARQPSAQRQAPASEQQRDYGFRPTGTQ